MKKTFNWRYDFASHLGLFILYNVFFLLFMVGFSLLSLFGDPMIGKTAIYFNNYWWDGELFYLFPAKYVHLIINVYIFLLVKFKIQD